MLFHGHLKRQGSPRAPSGDEEALLGALSSHQPGSALFCEGMDGPFWVPRAGEPKGFCMCQAHALELIFPGGPKETTTCTSEVTTLSPVVLGPQGLSLAVFNQCYQSQPDPPKGLWLFLFVAVMKAP